MTSPRRLYFAGELFSLKDLAGNAALAEEIHALSGGRILPVLPQIIEHRPATAKRIRDRNLETLRSCQLALFNFDGLELDSGTVVEFVTAKMLDIPSVLLRTDFRAGGDQGFGGEPWNLMCSFFPRTVTLLAPAMELVSPSFDPMDSAAHSAALGRRSHSQDAAKASQELAKRVIAALEEAASLPSPVSAEDQARLAALVPRLCGLEPGNACEERAWIRTRA